MNQIFVNLAIEQVLLPVVGFIITALLGWAAQRFHAWTGYQIEARHRDALQSALENGVRYAINEMLARRPEMSAQDIVRIDRQAVIEHAEGYVRTSVPDALHHFGLDNARGKLTELVVTKLPLPFGLDTLLGR